MVILECIRDSNSPPCSFPSFMSTWEVENPSATSMLQHQEKRELNR